MRLPRFNCWAGALLALSAASFGANAQLYDAIVVGSGPGGLVAAEYLSRDSSVSVLILEAGPKSLAATGNRLPQLRSRPRTHQVRHPGRV